MGWRSIRIGLDHPLLLRHQLRALLRAAARKRLLLMFPMISEVAEFDAARAILDLELERVGKTGDALPSEIKVGAMIEVPALVWQLAALLPRVDFVSIGSNDLLQFLFASDRGSSTVSERYDMLSPAVLSMLRTIVESCDRAGVPLALCGEMAGRPLEAMALVGVGLRSLSMAPRALGPVKAMLRSLDATALEQYLETLYSLPDRSVRAKLKAFALDHGVAI